MKWLLAAAAATVVVVAGILFLPASKPTGPEPIDFGRAACAQCRMHLAQPGWGGQMRDAQGVLTTYDDVGCLLIAMWKQHRETTDVWVEDHARHGFVPLTAAWFVRGDGLGTPMGYGVVAFAEEADARRFMSERGGQLGRLEDVLREPERFSRAHLANGQPHTESHSEDKR